MVLMDLEGHWVRANQALARLLGYRAEELEGRRFDDFTHPDDRDADLEALYALAAGERSGYETEKRYLRADGQEVWASLTVSLVRDSDRRPLHLIAQIQDITERRATEQELTARALHDPLTGLPNRLLFMDRAEVALARLQRPAHAVAVFFLDLDRFKLVNDRLGHAAGDRVLVAVAERLQSLLRPSDTVSRFGGDEFTILCEDTDEDAAGRVAARIAEHLSEPIEGLSDQQLFLSASIGIAVERNPRADPEQILRDADAAMYLAKHEGRSGFALHPA
jgi:diguanylate cyclase (GGDEF)-like protein/PAS domain S-box-containing protein